MPANINLLGGWPMPSLFEMEITNLPGVGKKRAKLYEKLGVFSVGDLLMLYPRTYESWKAAASILEAPLDEVTTVRGTVLDPPQAKYSRNGMLLYKVLIADDRYRMELTFFNNRYIPDMLKPGREYLFRGKIQAGAGYRTMASPQFMPADRVRRLNPVYPATSGLSSRQIAANVESALKLLPETVNDPLPLVLRERYNLCHLGYALTHIHLPADEEDLAEVRKRLIFEEFLVLQLGLMRIKSGRLGENLHKVPPDFPKDFARLLPFKLTNAQKRAIGECLNDMASPHPMNRLIQGDVGSGKTAVAAALCFVAARGGGQAVIMAPTEILANQHFETLTNLLSPAGIKVGLLTGAVKGKQRREIYSSLESGETEILIGTHALLNSELNFKDLALVVTDEQHRFGVNQRSALQRKGNSPHLLVMSATPIPRTLALMIYGDLDISVLDELPPGRQKIETYLITPEKRERAFRYVKKHLDAGRQAYMICPLIEGDESGLMSVDEYSEIVRRSLPGVKIATLHGRMKSAEKDGVMSAFARGETEVLISTTVVEVGVDVPNAVIMLIENAERYGLSQLHQLRGRVGRGEHRSTCILIAGSSSEETLSRLRLFRDTSNGFEIAEADLKLRGPGDFFGSRQHGLPKLKIADMSEDLELLTSAQGCARELMASGALSAPEYRGLLMEMRRLFRDSPGALN